MHVDDDDTEKSLFVLVSGHYNWKQREEKSLRVRKL